MPEAAEAAAPTPQASLLLALPDWRAVDFISDLHLSAELPRTFEVWSGYLDSTSANAIFILGDLFEAWVGDDTMEAGFERACAQLLQRACLRRPVWFMRGNRDFLIGRRFFEHTGVGELADPTAIMAWGETVLLSHGDALCLADTDYQRFRVQVRSPDWQRDFLARPLAERLQIAADLRAASRDHQRRQSPVTFADADTALATQWLNAAGARVLVHGHTHRPASDRSAEGWRRHVLSDWDLDHAVPPRAEVLRWTADGFARLSPAAA